MAIIGLRRSACGAASAELLAAAVTELKGLHSVPRCTRSESVRPE